MLSNMSALVEVCFASLKCTKIQSYLTKNKHVIFKKYLVYIKLIQNTYHELAVQSTNSAWRNLWPPKSKEEQILVANRNDCFGSRSVLGSEVDDQKSQLKIMKRGTNNRRIMKNNKKICVASEKENDEDQRITTS